MKWIKKNWFVLTIIFLSLGIIYILFTDQINAFFRKNENLQDSDGNDLVPGSGTILPPAPSKFSFGAALVSTGAGVSIRTGAGETFETVKSVSSGTFLGYYLSTDGDWIKFFNQITDLAIYNALYIHKDYVVNTQEIESAGLGTEAIMVLYI